MTKGWCPMNGSWNLDFISEENFYQHVKSTVEAYRAGMKPFNTALFNSNTIDPIKLLLDKSIYQKDWKDIVSDEVFRQRDKGNNNSIGYFHQNIFRYIEGCEVPQAGWDVIYKNPNGIDIGDGVAVSTIYVEMKNKHNTMNSASAAKTYSKAQEQLLQDDDSACFLVEAIAKQSQNIPWSASVDGARKSHKLIRRVSMDQFYKVVTGDELAFWKVCQKLPSTIERVIDNLNVPPVPFDTVYDELAGMSKKADNGFIDALYLLGFSTYFGFGEVDYGEVEITNPKTDA